MLNPLEDISKGLSEEVSQDLSEKLTEKLSEKLTEDLSFEQAIDLTQAWLEQVALGSIAPEQIPTDLTHILRTEQGVRGFFVTFLTGDSPLADDLPPALVQGFVLAIDSISSILVKNLAMSTGMILTHDRNGDDAQKAGSHQVQQRSLRLIQVLSNFGLPPLQQHCEELLNSLKTGIGSYQSFLDRWGYDDEQRQAMQTILDTAINLRRDQRV